MSVLNAELAEVARLVGAPVQAVERSPYGFTNRTEIVTLANGECVVLQRILNQAHAAKRLRLGRVLPERFAAVGLYLPRQLHADVSHTPPYAVREYLPGVPASTLLANEPRAAAQLMGTLLPQIARVPVADLQLDATWSNAATLTFAAKRWLHTCQPHLDPQTTDVLNATITTVPEMLYGATSVFAHGDFCPVNVLVERSKLALSAAEETNDQAPSANSMPFGLWSLAIGPPSGILDVEYARIAHPLFDVAWWGWVVRYHHPAAWRIGWPTFLAAAGIIDTPSTAPTITILQQLRLLELLADAVDTNGTVRLWQERLSVTCTW